MPVFFRDSQQDVVGSRCRRPNFVNQKILAEEFSCQLCAGILIDPQQTICGARVCKPCLRTEFKDNQVINCPLTHSELDDIELGQELCQQKGLCKTDVFADKACQRLLLKERCYCYNEPYGCQATPMWKDLNKHYKECDFAEIECKHCNKAFIKYNKLVVHQKTHIPCMTSGGKCYYYDYCKFEAGTPEELQHHMREEQDLHLQALAMNAAECEYNVKNIGNGNIHKIVDKAARLQEQLDAAESAAENLVDSMKKVNQNKYHAQELERSLEKSTKYIHYVLPRAAANEDTIEECQQQLNVLDESLKDCPHFSHSSYESVLLSERRVLRSDL
ncbi:TNF receptor-associated factor 5-like [Watersipora subatra]|uniref:TNF receptor-associated factor 5-like n=1 Tax=Watersipora subatra TaxID=2589382 RepID=UPI00355C226D